MAINLGGGQVIDPTGGVPGQFQQTQQAGAQQGQALQAQLAQALGQLNLQREVQAWNQFKDLYQQEQERLVSMGQPAYKLDRQGVLNLMNTAGVQPSEEQVNSFLTAQDAQLGAQEQIRLLKEEEQLKVLGGDLPALSEEVQAQVGTTIQPKDLAEFTRDHDSFVLNAADPEDTTGFPREVRQQLWDILNEQAGGNLGALDNARLRQAVKDGKLTVPVTEARAINQSVESKVAENRIQHSESLNEISNEKWATNTRPATEFFKPSGQPEFDYLSNSTPAMAYSRAVQDRSVRKAAQNYLERVERVQARGEDALFGREREQMEQFATDFQNWSMQDIAALAEGVQGYVPIMLDQDKIQVQPSTDGATVEINLPQNFFGEVGALQEEVPVFGQVTTESKISELQDIERQFQEAGFGAEAPGTLGQREALTTLYQAQAQNMFKQALSTGKVDNTQFNAFADQMQFYMNQYAKMLQANKNNTVKTNTQWAGSYGAPGGAWDLFVDQAALAGVQIGSAPAEFKKGFLNLGRGTTGIPTGGITQGRVLDQTSNLTGEAGKL